ncbi:immediate early response 3-interacting protein 1 [Frankliniella occidentalis]|uniref:Immediate early response 3-interacting protein 1 n=1 Tax=Frankliniella occidentalis TaxID=133901 RepID=A0A6J1TCA9_FRAOC|nr:immediate early response 3-interacting protein 1 [Frankliniella occidentalis]
MSFTLMHLIEAIVLILNAICVLHEERFMKRMGWGANAQVQGFGEQPTVTAKLLNLVRSIRTVVRVPLILFNSVLIAFKLVLG